ncbi:MAG: type II toxin-antitoxin system VapC family toxin [Planctomycetota bacterium]
MKLVLDTCVFIWLGLQPEQISRAAQEAIARSESCIASITFMELGHLIKKGRVALPGGICTFSELVIEAHRIQVLPLTAAIIERAMNLPETVNKDPADRIISASAIDLGCHLATADGNLRAAAVVPTIW